MNNKNNKKNKISKNSNKISKNSNNKINKIFESLELNYKSWVVIFICLFFLPVKESSFLNKIFSFFLMLIISYYFHYIAHVDTCNSSVHLYHHENNNLFSHFIQILLEFVTILLIIPVNYLFNITILDNWTVVLFYLFYTTVHNINYSIFHINTIHEKHHKEVTTNIGPDICDILFDTKHDENIENTDHYILNILVAYIIVCRLHSLWSSSDGYYQIYFKNIFGFVFGICAIIVLYFTLLLENPLFPLFPLLEKVEQKVLAKDSTK